MTTTERAAAAAPAPALSGVRWAITDSLLMAQRNLKRMSRRFDYIVFAAIQPVMFILLFNYVFGGAIATATDNYADFLIPGVMVQTVLFSAMNTGMGLAEDLNQGMVDRYRSLPMSRIAVVAGRILADTVTIGFGVLLMLGVGFLIGFRFHGTLLEAIAVPLLALFFAVPFMWVSATLGVWIRNVETMQSAGFLWLFPLTFISSAFVPVESMNPIVRGFAGENPVTIAVDAVRGLALGNVDSADVWKTLAWGTLITVVAAAAAVNRYRKI
ncbi:MAG: ABC transporter permease [Chloroflexi bacterium]|nr:ABC transporter permease [Chloroflexota bacterium]MDA1145138.1 ABC transporter permease [Chloroflexota bacterium]